MGARSRSRKYRAARRYGYRQRRDHLFGPLDPAGTADLLMGLDLPSVAGNQDRELIDGSLALPGGTLERNRMALSTRHLDCFAGLPQRLELPHGVLMFHGTPEHDNVYFLESVHADGKVSRASVDEVLARRGDVLQSLLICGHTHIPRTLELPGQQRS